MYQEAEDSNKFIFTDIILLDIVGFSKLSNTQQYALVSSFSELFRKTLSIMCNGSRSQTLFWEPSRQGTDFILF